MACESLNYELEITVVASQRRVYVAIIHSQRGILSNLVNKNPPAISHAKKSR